MIVESGIVRAIDARGAWVETVRQSTCKSCGARAGCGQRMMNDLVGETTLVLALLDDSDQDLVLNQKVTIGVPREVVALGSLAVYLLPIVALLMGALIGNVFFGPNWGAGVGAFLGLACGGLFLIKQTKKHRCNPKVHPRILPDSVNTDLL